MMRLRLRTPSRLHFGLLSRDPSAPRQFGGVGLMIDAPGLELSAEPAAIRRAEGPLAERALQIAHRVTDGLSRLGLTVPPALLRIEHAPPEHVGLGTGTQLGLAVARLLAALAGRSDMPVATLAELAGRGLRSGIGLHGFARGGLIVDGGRGPAGGLPPLLCHHPFPAEWTVLVIVPDDLPGLHGPDEVQAFSILPPIPEPVTDRLCRLVLLDLLPAVVEADLERFGEALVEIQKLVGEGFVPAQGGHFAHPRFEAIAAHLRLEGLHGLGQSSWGPSLYGFSRDPLDRRLAILHRVREQFALTDDSAYWTTANTRGAVLAVEQTADGR